MNVRLRMYQVLLFKFRRHLCKGSIVNRKPHCNLTTLCFCSSYDIILSYLVKNSIYRVSIVCKLTTKWYVMRMYASLLCSFKQSGPALCVALVKFLLSGSLILTSFRGREKPW